MSDIPQVPQEINFPQQEVPQHITIHIGEYTCLEEIARCLIEMARLNYEMQNPAIVLPGMVGKADIETKQAGIDACFNRALTRATQWGINKKIITQ
jgi:hypothetical protein